MNYFQKVIIKSNNKLFRTTWRQIDSYTISFQISNIYKFEIKLMLLFNEKDFNLYIDDKFIK